MPGIFNKCHFAGQAMRQIETCGDLATLHRWSDAVLTATDLQGVGLEI